MTEAGRQGRVAEWFKAPVLKTGRGFTLPRGFESHPLRQIYARARCAIRQLPATDPVRGRHWEFRMDEIVFREVDRETWSDFVSLFESRGGPKNCWCMVWRSTGAEAKQPDGANRRAAMKSRVDAGVPIG